MKNYELDSEIVLFGDYDYDIKRQIWNRRIQKYPSMIIYPENVQEVSEAVNFAVINKIPIRIRNGGHSYEGFSIDNNVAVIDLGKLNKVTVDNSNKLIKVGGGAKNKEIYEEVIKNGYVFPGGDCPNVGASGYTLSGGWSYISRAFGLGIDSLVEVELVDYKGNVIKANKDINSDLFWALRGSGGGNFGIITELTFKHPLKIKEITLVKLEIDNPTMEEQKEVIKIWQNWLNNLDNNMTMNISITNSIDDVKIVGTGFYIGSIENAMKVMNKFLNLDKVSVTFSKMPYKDLIELILSEAPHSLKIKNVGLFVDKNLTDNEINQIVSIVNNRPNGSVYVALDLYSFGGKIKDVKSNEMSYYYRNADYLMGVRTVYQNDTFERDNINYISDAYEKMKLFTIGNYVGNPYIELVDYEIAYYGKNKDRLEEVKQKYDPYNIFNFEQSIK